MLRDLPHSTSTAICFKWRSECYCVLGTQEFVKISLARVGICLKY